ncbi:hypothetical protein P5673_031332 [Acropora cervicornis]|uniref:Uncharacterized protein n=1 Tax=Acropora cervicornis TaxID=6130 RepID=A0AAD9PST1_ACRCE|nr:hypothetical protein P5673_031332 [Acropora cervicornis]
MEKPKRLRNQPLHSTCGILLAQFLQNTGTLFQLKLKSNPLQPSHRVDALFQGIRYQTTNGGYDGLDVIHGKLINFSNSITMIENKGVSLNSSHATKLKIRKYIIKTISLTPHHGHDAVENFFQEQRIKILWAFLTYPCKLDDHSPVPLSPVKMQQFVFLAATFLLLLCGRAVSVTVSGGAFSSISFSDFR